MRLLPSRLFTNFGINAMRLVCIVSFTAACDRAGLYLVCDHVVGPEGMTDADLYMTAMEQYEALELAGFREINVVLEKKGLVLFRAAA